MAYLKNQQLCDVWVSMVSTVPKINKSMSCLGPVLYSYETPIAHIVKSADNWTALVSEEPYSHTTSVHIGHARNSISKTKLKHFTVPMIGVKGGMRIKDSTDMNDVHACNLRYLTNKYASQVAVFRTKRNRIKNYYSAVQESDAFIAQYDKCVEYAKAFGLALEISLPFTDYIAISLTGRLK